MDITIVRNKRTRKFHLARDDEETLLPGHTYDTLAEAKAGAEQIIAGRSRIPQSFIERCLLNDDDDIKALGRLLASSAWPAFETWLNAERQETAEDATRVMNAVARFAAIILAGVAHEHWPDSGEVNEAILGLVGRAFSKMRRG
jgi:hypothetical protein